MFKDADAAIAFIYCNYKERSEHSAHNLLASLLKQFVQDSPQLSDHVKNLYDTKLTARISREDLMKTLLLEIARVSRVYIVVDALDECTEEDNTRADFLDQLRSLPDNVNLLVTSRNTTAIKREFEGVRSIEIRATDDDVTRYITERIKRENRLARHVKMNPNLQDIIVNRLLDKAKGMYVS